MRLKSTTGSQNKNVKITRSSSLKKYFSVMYWANITTTDINSRKVLVASALFLITHLVVCFFFYFVIGNTGESEMENLLNEHKNKHNWDLVECQHLFLQIHIKLNTNIVLVITDNVDDPKSVSTKLSEPSAGLVPPFSNRQVCSHGVILSYVVYDG